MSDVYDTDMSVNKLIVLWRQVFMLIFNVCYERFMLYCIENLCSALVVDPLFLPPRRETSRRKAKEKTSMKQLLDRQQNLDEEFDADEPEFVDSDSDPAWTPAAKVMCSLYVYYFRTYVCMF